MPLLRKRPSNIKYSEKEHDKEIAKAAIKWHLKGSSSKKSDSNNEPTSSSEGDKNKDGNAKKSVNLSLAINTRNVPEVVFSSDGRKFFPCHFCCRAFAFKKRQVTHMDICLFKNDKRRIAKFKDDAAAVTKPDLEEAEVKDKNDGSDFEYDEEEEEFSSSLTENSTTQKKPKKKLTLLRFKTKDDMNCNLICSNKSLEGSSPIMSQHFIVQTYSEDELDECDQVSDTKSGMTADESQSPGSPNPENKSTEVPKKSVNAADGKLNKGVMMLTTKENTRKPFKIHIPQVLEKSNKVKRRSSLIRPFNRPSDIPSYFFQSIQLRHSRKVLQDKTKVKVRRLTRGALRRIKSQAKLNHDKLNKKRSNKRMGIEKSTTNGQSTGKVKSDESTKDDINRDENEKLRKRIMASNLESPTIQKVTSSLDTLSLNSPIEETQTNSVDSDNTTIPCSINSDNNDKVVSTDQNKEKSQKEIEKEFAGKLIKNFENILSQKEIDYKNSLPSTSGLQKISKDVDDKLSMNLRSKSNYTIDKCNDKEVESQTSVNCKTEKTTHSKDKIDNEKVDNDAELSTKAKTNNKKNSRGLSAKKSQKLQRLKCVRNSSSRINLRNEHNKSKQKKVQQMLLQEKVSIIKKTNRSVPTVKRVSFGESTIINEDKEKEVPSKKFFKTVKRNSSTHSSGLGVLKSRRLRTQNKLQIKTIPKQIRKRKLLTVKTKRALTKSNLRVSSGASATILRKLRGKSIHLKARLIKSRMISHLPKKATANVQAQNSSQRSTSDNQEAITKPTKPIHQVGRKIKPTPSKRPIIIIKTASQINRLSKEEVDRLFNSLKENKDANNAGSSSQNHNINNISLPSTSRDTTYFAGIRNSKKVLVQTDQVASCSSLNLRSSGSLRSSDSSNNQNTKSQESPTRSSQQESEVHPPRLTASGILERHKKEMMERERANQNKPPVNASVYDFDETEDEILGSQQSSKKRKYRKRSIKKDGSPVRKRQRRPRENGLNVAPNLKELEQDIAEVSITSKAVNFPLLEFSSVMQPKVCPFPYCNQLFKSEEEFIEHKIVKHQIGRILLGPDKLAKYDEVYQNSDKNKCPICFREITVTMNWKRHLKTHSKERDFSCTICKKTFSRADHMKNHEKRHLETIKQAFGVTETENLSSNPEP